MGLNPAICPSMIMLAFLRISSHLAFFKGVILSHGSSLLLQVVSLSLLACRGRRGLHISLFRYQSQEFPPTTRSPKVPPKAQMIHSLIKRLILQGRLFATLGLFWALKSPPWTPWPHPKHLEAPPKGPPMARQYFNLSIIPDPVQ
jgi:hypothetical protein